MIVRDFDVVGVAVTPPKTDPPLIVDTDAVLPDAIPGEFLQSVAWRNPEVGELFRGVHEQEFPERRSLQSHRPAPGSFAAEYSFRVAVGKAPDQSRSITQYVIIVKRYYPAIFRD